MNRRQLALELIRLSELVRTYAAAGWAVPEALAAAYHLAGQAWDRDSQAARHRAQPPVRVPAPRSRFVVDDPRATAPVRSSR